MSSKCESGVYKITCNVSNRVYIGSAFKFSTREYNHFYALERNDHWNSHLQSAYNLYGRDAFIFEILEYVPRLKSETKSQYASRLVEGREQHYLDTLLFASKDDNRFHELGFNSRRRAESNAGWKQPQSTKDNLSALWKGKKRPRTKQHSINLSKALKGKNKGIKKPEGFSEHLSSIRKGANNPSFGRPSSKRKAVLQIDLITDIIVKEFSHVTLATKEFNTLIFDVLKGRAKSAYGFKWRYKDQSI